MSLLLLFLPTPTLACGLPFNARISSEQALISYADGQEEIITSVQLTRAGKHAAVMFPVPSVPQVSVVQSADVFVYLGEVTRPQVVEEERIVWRNQPDDQRNAGAVPGQVRVVGRELIGGYDVAQLSADDPNALQTWLDQNGYQLSAAAAPILSVYTNAGWTFVAIKLAADQPADGALKPLRMAFPTREIVYPMRLGALADTPLDVSLYVLSDRRVVIDGLETQYAGPVARLDTAPTAEMLPLFRAPYLTKLRNFNVAPASLAADFIARPAATNAPFRQTETRIVYVDGWQRMQRPIIALACVGVMSLLGLGISVAIWRQFKRIAPPQAATIDQPEDSLR